MIRMIGLDLDGTLLTRDKRLTKKNSEVLAQAARRGIHIVPVTGRPLSGIPEAVEALPFIRYVITSNGAVITDRAKNRTIRARLHARKETALEVLKAAEGNSIIREFFTEGRGFHDPQTHRLLWNRFAGTPILDYLRKSRTQVEDLYGSLSEKRGGIENISIMCASPAQRGDVLSRVSCIEGIRIIFPWPTDLEIVSEDADKGEAFLDLAAELGIQTGEVMAMGDGNNDLGLMRAAGLSVAMGNSDHEVIAAADHITADNEHDGVAEAILKFVL